MHCVILVPSPLPCWQSGPNLTCGLQVGLPNNTDHSSLILPRGGHDFLSALFVLKQSGVKIKPPRGTVGQCPLRPASLPSVALRSLSGLPKLRALSPGPPACLFSESQRPLAPCPCAAAGSGTASTSPPCCTWRKEVVLVGPLVCLHPHHRRQTGTCFSMELVLVLDSVSIAQIGLILTILLSWL